MRKEVVLKCQTNINEINPKQFEKPKPNKKNMRRI